MENRRSFPAVLQMMMTTQTTTIRSSFLLLLLIISSTAAFSIPMDLLALEAQRIRGSIHQFDKSLSELYAFCEKTETQSASAAGYCAIVRNERANALPPSLQLSEMKRIESLLEIFEKGPLPLDEKLFIEMRLYAYRPQSYGQSFGKSLLALESLKRLKPATPNLAFYEKEIRFLQGKKVEDSEFERAEVDSILGRNHFGWTAGIQYMLHLGLLGTIGYEDDKLNDGSWGTRIRGYASTKPLFGAVGGVSYTQSDSFLDSSLKFSSGKEEFFGLSADSSDANLENYKLQRVELLATYQYWLTRELGASVGLRVKDVHITEPLESSYSLVGPYVKVVLDEMDQETSPRWGHRVSMYGYFHRFQQFGLEVRLAVPVTSKMQLNFGSFYEEQFGKVPVFAHLRLGETHRVPGASINRFQDRALVGGWGEVRHELMAGLGGGIFSSASFVGDTLDDSFKHRSLQGLGAFLDWRWTRFPQSDARVEVSQFVDETIIQIGVAQAI